MSKRGGRPGPLPLSISPLKNKQADVKRAPPSNEVLGAAQRLQEKNLSEKDITEALSVLRHVTWKQRQAENDWADVEEGNELCKQLEAAWLPGLTMAVGHDGEAMCRLCGLKIKDHPFCSKTGVRHTELPKMLMSDMPNYRRTYNLPSSVKDYFQGPNLAELTTVMRHNINHFDVLIFVLMVVTEITSPKLVVDSNKKELLDAGFLPLLLEAMRLHIGVELVAQDGCAVLRNILTHIPTQTAFEQHGGNQILVDCVEKFVMNHNLIHRACGCLLIMASRAQESREKLFDLGIVRTLVMVLNTRHGSEYMIRRLVATTFTKLLKSIDHAKLKDEIDKHDGFTIIQGLLNRRRNDDEGALRVILDLRGDLPRGTFVDPQVLVIDDEGNFHEESFVSLTKSNHRDYEEDPPTPTINPSAWPEVSLASPVFPSPCSFGGSFDEADDPFLLRSGGVSPGIKKGPGPMSDVLFADNDLAMHMYTSNSIATPSTVEQIKNAGVLHFDPAQGSKDSLDLAKKTIDLLNSHFREDGTFNQTKEFKLELSRSLDKMVERVIKILKPQPKLIDLEAPLFVFGDIHGNFGDLQYFMQRLTVLGGMKMTPHGFLFVGDYVDRGKWGPEVVAYLLAYKLLAPNDVHLLRGNHEDAAVNGDTELYGDGSFRNQMLLRFSESLGYKSALKLFDRVNTIFKYLPIAAVVNNKIFATHGGIPRKIPGHEDDRLKVLRRPDFAAFDDFVLTSLDMNQDRVKQHVYAHDCIWSDPVAEGGMVDEAGFGRSCRGGQVLSYSQQAIHSFLDTSGLDFIIRGHEEKADGLNISKQGRVLTVFSTSDYCRKGNRAGVALVRKLHNGDLVCRMIHRAKPRKMASAYD
eukprot:TRINITY_DN5539_c0_g1_i2.p1 TRINITY_DN5539_c0_g1~~TRINITY_DN5539_c0_g1_i2.p1  ORF type:complete len:862 (+),score=351.96 TRINITY_DN5539_c0_g1_i2:66-2651(+)